MRGVDRPRCVLLFSRSPRDEGSAKGLAEARSLFEFTRRRIASAAGELTGVDLILIGEGPRPEGVTALPQRGRTFGDRLRNAFIDVQALGYEQIVAVPSDVPSLGRRALAEAFAVLEAGGVALGPSPDGGVYLIGLAADPDGLLSNVRWLTPRVAEDLARNVVAQGGTAVWLAPLLDVDDRRALFTLAADADLDPLLAALLAAILSGTFSRGRSTRWSPLAPAIPAEPARGPPAVQAA